MVRRDNVALCRVIVCNGRYNALSIKDWPVFVPVKDDQYLFACHGQSEYRENILVVTSPGRRTSDTVA